MCLATTCVATANAKHRLSKFKGIFSSVAMVATVGELSKENFLLHLKECDLDIITVKIQNKRNAHEVMFL